MIRFMSGFDQGNRSVIQFEADLVAKIKDLEATTGSDCSFPRLLQFSLMARELHDDQRSAVLSALHEGCLDIRSVTTRGLCDFLRNFSDPTWVKFFGQSRRRRPSAPPAASAVTGTGGADTGGGGDSGAGGSSGGAGGSGGGGGDGVVVM